MEPTDPELVKRAMGGDRAAYDALVGQLYGRVLRYCASLLPRHEDAQDACSVAFEKAWKSRATFREGEPFVRWLLKIARNACLDTWSRDRRSPVEYSLEEVPDWPDPRSAFQERVHASRRLESALEELDALDRAILFLKYFRQLTWEEISGEVGIPTPTLRSRGRRILAILRDRLEKD